MRDRVEFLFVNAHHNFLEIANITNLQYPCNISKKEEGMKLVFSMKKNMKLYYKLITLIYNSMVTVIDT